MDSNTGRPRRSSGKRRWGAERNVDAEGNPLQREGDNRRKGDKPRSNSNGKGNARHSSSYGKMGSRRGGNGSRSGANRSGKPRDSRYVEDMKVTPARRIAVEVTREVRERDAYARELIDSRRPEWPYSKEDFDYMQVLVYGVVMCRGTLDKLINRNLNSPRDIKDNVRDALRISAYEILYLHKPDHVVVSQGVEMVRYVAKQAAGLGNAVLRKMLRDAAEFPWGDKDADDAAFARYYAVPQWFADALVLQYGREKAAELLQVSMEPAPTYAVDNPYLQPTQFAADLASQQTASMVPVDGTVLEVGAGRGTKTMLMQRNANTWYHEAATIHTVDIHEFKERLLRERMDKMRVPNVITHVGDGTQLESIEGLPTNFDAVFIDAPCSGTGTLRRHPEIRWNLTKKGVSELAQIQLRMLKSAAAYVRPGCVMVYATCSILRRENQEVVASFLKSEEGRGFEVVEAAPAFEEFEDSITEEGFFASLPTHKGPDGHFAVVLRRGE